VQAVGDLNRESSVTQYRRGSRTKNGLIALGLLPEKGGAKGGEGPGNLGVGAGRGEEEAAQQGEWLGASGTESGTAEGGYSATKRGKKAIFREERKEGSAPKPKKKRDSLARKQRTPPTSFKGTEVRVGVGGPRRRSKKIMKRKGKDRYRPSRKGRTPLAFVG